MMQDGYHSIALCEFAKGKYGGHRFEASLFCDKRLKFEHQIGDVEVRVSPLMH